MNIGLFVPCYVDALFPEVAIATLELLEGLGIDVGYPADQTCCGQPMANSGCQPESAATEAHFAACFRDFETVVGPSGSCVHHVRFHLDATEQTSEVVRVRRAVRELVEFLHDDLKVGAFPRARFPHKVGLHDSCTAIRGLGHCRSSEHPTRPAFSKTRDLLAKVEGLALVEIDRPDECCGFGGSFCVTDEAVSSKMGEDRVRDFHRHGAEYIASADMSCLLHMKGIIDRLGLPLKVIHVAQILNGGPA
ncbi:(Fe-S)-binding protein [Paludisphaera mucosa]|uniref:(Fe-S)-binding protein n=1 Tax=Paludisphaera mucosa TaxID=3030827 RepID=A0ABT6F9J7_9BACT|nr:(Fe-S)-binding protein [Paludisphaera mucosa]MDG3004267.1 (Fe-S)-binding protein [Paludisphaera mucosa]